MRVGRYEVFREIARGGMGAVHLARLTSEFGIGRVVAVKRLHAHASADAQFVSMFLDEARLCARVRHRNVVALLDLVSNDEELCMVLEYVEGETLAKLLEATRGGERIPDRVVAGLLAGALHGLHAAHEAKAEDGTPLGIVHRDFTPQNVLVGVDGVARVADFGVAKAAIRLQTTRDGQVKGKLGYMAPEQITGDDLDRRTDVFAAGVVLWETLVQKRLFTGDNEAEILMKILRGDVDPASDHVRGLDPGWDRILERALALSPEARFATAREMAMAIESSFPSAPASEVGEWVAAHASEALEKRAAWVSEVERAPASSPALIAPAESLEATTASTLPARRSLGPVFGVALVAALGIGAAFLWRGASSGEVAAASPPLEERAPVLSSSPLVEPAPAVPSEAPAPLAPPSTSAPRAPVVKSRPPATPKPSPAAACRYFDETEKIWKFRRGCYK